MMNRFLKALAISFGGGVALGAGIRIGQASVKPRSPAEQDPLRHRLDEFEGRIERVESTVHTSVATGLADYAAGAFAPAPAAASSATAGISPAVSRQIEDLQKLRGEIRNVDRKIEELESRLPELIRSGVTARVDEAYTTLRREIEEVHNHAVKTLVETLQNNVMQRMSVIEGSLTEQSRAIGDLRQASVRNDQSLQKMLAGIEHLRDQSKPPSPASGGPGAAPASGTNSGTNPGFPPSPTVARPSSEGQTYGSRLSFSGVAASAPTLQTEKVPEPSRPLSFELIESRPVSSTRWRTPATVALLALLVLSGLGFGVQMLRKRMAESSDRSAPVTSLASAGGSSLPAVGGNRPGEAPAMEQRPSGQLGDSAAVLEMCRDYVRRKDWARAESAYRAVLQTDPRNREAVQGLSDVLYQLRKFEESAAVFNSLSAGRM